MIVPDVLTEGDIVPEADDSARVVVALRWEILCVSEAFRIGSKMRSRLIHVLNVSVGQAHSTDLRIILRMTEVANTKPETINMGQVGYGVDQAFLWYRRDADDLDVDVQFLAFIPNDS